MTTTRARRSRAIGLSARLALASLGTAIAIGVVCAVGLSSLENTAAVARVAVGQQLALIDDAAAMGAFQYQKGFVAEYLLTGNREWLAELETSRPAFESWLAGAHAKAADPASGEAPRRHSAEYAAYDRARKTAITLYDARRIEEARVMLEGNHVRTQRLRDLFHDFGRTRAKTPSGRSPTPSDSVRRLAHLLVGTSIAGAIASLLAGLLVGAADHEADLRARGTGPVGGGTDANPGCARPGQPGIAGRSGARAGREARGDRRGAGRAPASADAEREVVRGRRAGGQTGARGVESRSRG